MPSTAIVKYNGILARRQQEKAALIARPRRYRQPTLHFGRLDDHRKPMQMPKAFKRLMYEEVPLGTFLVNTPRGSYRKFNGMPAYTIRLIAEYLLSISETDRKNIIETMLLNCRSSYLKDIFDLYQKHVRDDWEKSTFRILTGGTIRCDQSGVVHG